MDIRPQRITYHRAERKLEIHFSDGATFTYTAEYLRVYSPSAEVKGHGPGQEVLQVGKEDVEIVDLHPVGHYAVRIFFSDGHDSGIYTWEYLYALGREQDRYWADYLRRLAEAGYARRPP
ncbi:MAG: DUF971 domain-containing protein [Bacteroidetes bacterium]|nr:DUF971 domain-containing protein [Rhodothermia bacterium]MCS7154848.1 DUF971 domain-containing protein [Bacteroidota bacterium]MCX7906994.1 DUF971 domain-containing protein [Bacteroidota bacterium]MDW8137642.1 DUF971 domain-containing protein [Bacteroidota bacterium]MDW8285404.1 DUF971 domain-containing protein [Bacteroidota bacterium]